MNNTEKKTKNKIINKLKKILIVVKKKQNKIMHNAINVL